MYILVLFVCFVLLTISFFFFFFFFFFNDTATTEIYTLSLHDALPIRRQPKPAARSSISVACRGPSSARRARYSSAGAAGARPSKGAHHRRIAKPSWESNCVVPGGAGRSDSVICCSNPARGMSPPSAWWTWWSTRARVATAAPTAPASAIRARCPVPPGARPERCRAGPADPADQVQQRGHGERGQRDAADPPEPGAVGDRGAEHGDRARAVADQRCPRTGSRSRCTR